MTKREIERLAIVEANQNYMKDSIRSIEEKIDMILNRLENDSKLYYTKAQADKFKKFVQWTIGTIISIAAAVALFLTNNHGGK
jgi:hypothetical protein